MSEINKLLEIDTRELINEKLKNLGWIFSGKNQNVWQEQPRTKEEKRLLGGKEPDYVLYTKDERGKYRAVIIIEAKKVGECLDKAIKQGVDDYARPLNAPLVFATDGVLFKAYHTQFNKTPLLDGNELNDYLRESLAKRYLTHWEVNTISPKVVYDRNELIKIFNEANKLLRRDGLRAGIERFNEFANILFLKLISEESESNKDLKFKDSCHWNIINNMHKSGRREYINNHVYIELNKLYETTIFTPLTIRNEDILNDIMDKLDPLTLTDVDSDIKGDAFEYFLKKSTSIPKNDLGEYFTPRHIVEFMVKIVNPQIGEKVYDPFCGTGGFLIETFKYIWNTMARNKENKTKLEKETVFGNEITNTARIAKMNMILTGDGHSNVEIKDSLANPVNGGEEYEELQSNGDTVKRYKGYDVVITNIPFSQKETNCGGLYGMSTNNGDSMCIRHCMKAVNAEADNGRMAIIVPEGVLFRTANKDETATRELLLNEFDIQSIISLPQGVFEPYTGVKTNIIYAKKKKKSSSQKSHFWYYNVNNDGYSLNKQRRKLEGGNDLEIYQKYRKLNESQKEDMLKSGFETIPLDKVKSNSYILVASRYRKQKSLSMLEVDIKTLGEIIDIRFGTRITQKNNTGTLFPVYGGGDISFYTDNFTNENEYVISRFGMSEECVRHIKDKFYLLDSGFTFEIKKEYINDINKDYIGKLLINIQDKIYACGRGQAQKNIEIELFNAIKVPIPPLDIQIQIANEIERYQRIIEGAKAVVDNYIPTVKIEPKWEVIKLGEVCEFSGGTQPPKDTFKYKKEDGYIRLLQIRDYKNDDFETYIPITEKHKTCCENDIMIGRYGPPVFQILRGKSGAYNVALIKCIIDEEKITNDWLFYFLSSPPIQDYIIGCSVRARQSGVSIKDLKNLEIPLPPIEIQKQIVSQIESEQALIEPSKRIIEVFTKKIQDRTNELLSK